MKGAAYTNTVRPERSRGAHTRTLCQRPSTKFILSGCRRQAAEGFGTNEVGLLLGSVSQ